VSSFTRQPARQIGRLLALFVLTLVALQLVFVTRIALMAWIDPGSTSFQRSEIWRMAQEQGRVEWAHQWVKAQQIGEPLKRAVIASEDAGFADHSGVEWDAIERAWERNQRAEARADKLNERSEPRGATRNATMGTRREQARVIGGSTITQQLAKNLFLSSERTVLRKSQELVLTYALEAFLSKRRILEIYLNHVEWGEGVFGAQMAAQYYHRSHASALSNTQAAKLAVMLPAPKRFEKRPNSPYIQARAAVVAAGMQAVELP
jgi:monofunctional glycosyltransferase